MAADLKQPAAMGPALPAARATRSPLTLSPMMLRGVWGVSLACALAALFVVSPSAAEPSAGPPRPTLPMSLAQHRAFRRLEFEMMDLNHDGVLTAEEFNARQIRELHVDDLARARAFMLVACGDVGDTCSFAQFQAQGDAEFRRVDLNGDGLISADELKANGGSMHSRNP